MLNDDFRDVRDGKIRQFGELKKRMIESMVRLRDAEDETRRCEQCGILPELPNRCSRCKMAVYCSRSCQTEHWRKHKKKCVPSNRSDMGMWSLKRNQPASPPHGLICAYQHSVDEVDTNLMIVVHGNGDNEVNFLRFASKLNFPLTAMMSVRGPISVGMQGHMWYLEPEGYKPRREDTSRISRVWEAAELLNKQIKLAVKAGWKPHRIFLFGHGHGGVVALDAARRVGVTLGGVVTSGEAVLPEAILDDPIPTRVVKRELEMKPGDTVDFLELKLEFLSSKRVDSEEDSSTPPRWQYKLLVTEKAPTAASEDLVKHFPVTFAEADIGSTRARAQVGSFFEDKYLVRFSQYGREGCHVSIEATVYSMEEANSKLDTPVLVCTGAKDQRLSEADAEAQVQYVRRKFRIVEYRRYKMRKDVLGSDADEINDIRGFFLLCAINKPRLEPVVTQNLESHPEELKAIPRKELEARKKR